MDHRISACDDIHAGKRRRFCLNDALTIASLNDLMTQSTQDNRPVINLARSAFGFALLAFVFSLIAFIWWLLSPPASTPALSRLRWGIITAAGLLTLATFALSVWAYRTPPESIIPATERIANGLRPGWVAVGGIILLIVLVLAAWFVLRGIAPAIVNPGIFLLGGLALIGVLALLTVQRDRVTVLATQSSGFFAALGATITAVICFGILVTITGSLIEATGINDRLRGSLDFRPLTFYDDGTPAPAPADFWQEQAQTRVRWSPYTYWVVDEFAGAFIRVGRDGIRHTPDWGEPGPRVGVFGGSTVWGEGARDAYTISGHLDRLLAEENIAATVVNYGQTGYVSAQDLIWFQQQLATDDPPDVAIFYQGFNDILSAWRQDVAGLTLQEGFRVADSEAGRRLRAGNPVLRLPSVDLTTYDFSAAGVYAGDAAGIVARYAANLQQVESLADAYGIETIFVWQPALIFKETRTPIENDILTRTERDRPGLFALYEEVDTLIRAERATSANFVVLSDLFATDEATIFHDLVHITEVGNLRVAQSLLPVLRPALSSER